MKSVQKENWQVTNQSLGACFIHRYRTATKMTRESKPTVICPPGMLSRNPGLLSAAAAISSMTDKIQ